MKKNILHNRKLLFSVFLFILTILYTGYYVKAENTPVTPGETVYTNHISMDGVVFYFDDEYEAGIFANGDYWVIGPVTITEITPEYISIPGNERNGWQVNPMPGYTQGFDSRAGEFDAELVPDLPFVAEPGISIVKTISNPPLDGNPQPSVLTAVVLTVLGEVPPENGAAVFRPPYVGTYKPMYRVSDIRRELIPQLDIVPNAPSLAKIYDMFRPVQMDHTSGRISRWTRPLNSLPNYGADKAKNTADGALRLMIGGGPEDEYLKALIAYLQCGLDYYHFVVNGQTWPGGGGEQPGSKLPIVFFVTLLGDTEMQEFVRNLELYEDNMVSYGKNNVAIWGNCVDWQDQEQLPESYYRLYWQNIAFGTGNKSRKDPHDIIDGGRVPGGDYQYVTSQPFKGVALALHLMPALKTIWNPQALLDYVDRWVYFGAWTLPDPYATSDGNAENYGVTWGMDPQNPGEAIKDYIGRFPDLHGTQKDKGNRKSAFQGSLWNAYRTTADGAEDTLPFAAIISPYDGQIISENIVLQASAYGIHGVNTVQFMANGDCIGELLSNASSEPPYAYQTVWDTTHMPNGFYALTAVVTDGLGNSFESGIVEVYVENSLEYDFTISDVSINKSAGITVEAKVTSNTGVGGNAAVIFKLVKNDGTVVGLTSNKLYINDESIFKVNFHGYSGDEYNVKIFLWDKLDSSNENIGENMAEPVEIQ